MDLSDALDRAFDHFISGHCGRGDHDVCLAYYGGRSCACDSCDHPLINGLRRLDPEAIRARDRAARMFSRPIDIAASATDALPLVNACDALAGALRVCMDWIRHDSFGDDEGDVVAYDSFAALLDRLGYGAGEGEG